MRTWRIVGVTVVAGLAAASLAGFAFVKTRGLSARHKPSGLEYAIANFALAQSIPQSARTMTNPSGSSAAALAAGSRDFHELCAVCHGDDGVGKTATAAGMSPEVPDLHAAHVQKWTDGELFFIIKNGVRFTGMPGWDLDDARIWGLVSNVRTFRTNGGSAAAQSGSDFAARARVVTP